MQKKIRVGAVSYLNTKPLIFGFEQGKMEGKMDLILDYPSHLSSLLQKNKLDIALLPVASISSIIDAQIIGKYCIGTHRKVASVALYSQVPIEDIQQIYLDYQSRTSIALLRILLRNFWHVRPSLFEGDENYITQIKDKNAGLIIGDRALENNNKFPYIYDLAEAWNEHTQLPFVFAAWVANKEIDASFIEEFNEANAMGLQHLDTIIANNPFPLYDLKTYYTENISYHLDDDMQKGLTMFLKLLAEMN